MKSLPEKEFWKAIASRLERYREEPADDWDRIAGAIPSGNTGLGLNQASDILAVVLLAFMLGFQVALHQGNTRATASIAALTETERSPEKRMARVEPSLSSIPAYRESLPGDEPRRADTDGPRTIHWQRRMTMEDSVGNEKNTGVETKMHERAGLARRNEDRYPPEQTQDLQSVDDSDGRVARSETDNNTVDVSSRAKDPVGMNESPVVKDTVAVPGPLKRDTAIVSSPSQAMKEKEKKRKKFRPSVYVQATPSLTYQKIIPVKDDQVEIQKLNASGVMSAQRFGYSVEAGFQVLVSKKLEVFTALSYYQQQQTIGYVYTSPSGNLRIEQGTDAGSYTLSPGVSTRRFSYAMRNAGATLGFLYFLRGEKLMHKMGGGIHYQRGFRKAEGDDTYDNASSSYLGYQLLYRLEYVIGPRTNFFLQPSFMHAVFSDEVLKEPFRIKPSRAGIGVGVVYHF